jgi:hypothetical protein
MVILIFSLFPFILVMIHVSKDAKVSSSHYFDFLITRFGRERGLVVILQFKLQ